MRFLTDAPPYSAPDKLHSITMVSHNESVADLRHYLRWVKKHKPGQFTEIINRIDQYNLRPLFIALTGNLSGPMGLAMGIELLEQGAQPHAIQGNKVERANVLNASIEDDNLMVARLVLWYDPDYESLTSVDGKKPILAWLDEMQALQNTEVKKGKRTKTYELKPLLAETAASAREVIRLRKVAQTAHAEKDYLAEAQARHRIATIFFEQKAIEEGLPCPVSRVRTHYDVKEKRQLIIQYYHLRAKWHAEMAYRAYEAWYKQLKQKPIKSAEEVRLQREAVDSLIELSERFRWRYARWHYSQVRRRLVSLRSDDMNLSTTENDQAKPLLAKSTGRGFFSRRVNGRTSPDSEAFASKSTSRLNSYN